MPHDEVKTIIFKKDGFKPRKPLKKSKIPMKKCRIKKESKQKISVLQRKLWVYCKALTRKIHGNTCYTCGMKDLEGSNWHTGHLLSKASLGANLKYDLRVLRPQCAKCNIWGGGMGADFVRNMIVREGQEYVDQIFRERNSGTIKAYDHYLMLIEKYKLMLQEIGE